MSTITHVRRRPARRRLALAGAVAAGALMLTACGEDGNGSKDAGANPSSQQQSPAPGAFNKADVMFAQMMIPHHRQAVTMAESAPGRASDQEIKSLAGKIEKAQDPEIRTMRSWLKSWDKPESMPGMDHGGAEHHSGMPGMMSDEDMEKLKKAKGRAFDRMFAQMMIDHHKGAITMAEDEQKDGRNVTAKKLADKIIKAQTVEISAMNKILDRI
jgi:uncharacterized protein (DUF305 family)